MDIYLNFVGFLVALGGAIVVGRAHSAWQGSLREGIASFMYSFVLLAVGFLWNVFFTLGVPMHEFDIAFFSVGAIFALLGANKIFSLKTSAP